MRLGAVIDLGDLARKSDGRRGLAAIKALKELTTDDSKAVSAAAKAALSDILGQVQEEVGQNKGKTSGENKNIDVPTPSVSATLVRQAASSLLEANPKPEGDEPEVQTALEEQHKSQRPKTEYGDGEQKANDTKTRDPRLRFVARLSFVPFVLVLLSWLLPFQYGISKDNRELNGAEILCTNAFWVEQPFISAVLLSAFFCPIFVLSSHFLKYRWKAILEVVVSWLCFVLLATWILFPSLETLPLVRIGVFLACSFAAIGAVMKTIIYRRKLVEI